MTEHPETPEFDGELNKPLPDSSQQVSLDDKVSGENEIELSPLVAIVMERFRYAARERKETEERWLKAYQNYRGFYGRDDKFLDTEKSKAFIKITKTKTQASYGQLLEILFANGSIPITVEPTKVPEGIVGLVHVDATDPDQSNAEQAEGAEEETSPEEGGFDGLFDPGFEGDDNPLNPGETIESRKLTLGEKFKNIVFKKGAGFAKEHKTVDPAKIKAEKMEKKIHDQLSETNAMYHLCKSVFEIVLLGHGILKGPLVEKKEYPKWNEMGEYIPVIRSRPKIEHVSCWDFYPDPDTQSDLDPRWAVQRHKMSSFELRALKNRPFFREKAIADAIARGSGYERLWWENSLREQEKGYSEDIFEVFEYWGLVEREFIEKELDKAIPDELSNVDDLQINAWVCNGELIRVVLNPFKPARLPYLGAPYEQDPYNYFGVGLPENMEDSQKLMNGFIRLAIDNAVLAGNIMIEVDESNLVPGQSMDVYPGKVWRRSGGAPGQSIFATKWPSTANENMQIYDKMRQLADETSGVPSFSHGQTGVTGIGRTAAGISMLMGAAGLQTKTVIKNLDTFLLRPLGEAFFAFNMQFDFDKELVGDLEIKARGTASLLQKEVRTQRLIQFLQIASNPMLAPSVNFDELLREIAESLDLDKDKLILDLKAALAQAKLIEKRMQLAAPQGAGGATPEQGQQPQGAAAPIDPTGGGGGQIGVGTAPTPNAEGFSGQPQSVPGENPFG